MDWIFKKMDFKWMDQSKSGLDQEHVICHLPREKKNRHYKKIIFY